MFCPKCGNEVGEAIFCPNCGEPINSVSRVNPYRSKTTAYCFRQKFKKKWIPILIGITVLILIAGIIFAKWLNVNTRKYIKLIDCFDATMGADSYLCKMNNEIQMEIFGKEENAILTMEHDGDVIVGTNTYWLKNGEVDMEMSNDRTMQKVFQALASRDVSLIYDQTFHPLFCINYVDLRAAGEKMLVDCVTNKKTIPFMTAMEKDNKYFFTIDLKEFWSWLQREGYNVEMDNLEDVHDYSEVEIIVEVAEGYINRFSVGVSSSDFGFSSDYSNEYLTFTFSKINKVTESNSIGVDYFKN